MVGAFLTVLIKGGVVRTIYPGGSVQLLLLYIKIAHKQEGGVGACSPVG